MRSGITRKTTLTAVTAAALMLMTTACGSNSADHSQAGKKKDIRIGLAISTLNNPFFVDIKKSAIAEAKAQGAHLVVQNAHDDASEQRSQISTFADKKVDSVVVNPVSSNAAGPPAKAASKSGIPIVTADRSIKGAKVRTAVASNNKEGGELAAESVSEELGGKGHILVLQGQRGTSASKERGEGFDTGLKKHPGIKVDARKPADFDRHKGRQVTSDMLSSHPDVDAVFAENDEMALGAIKALGDRAGKDVKVIGFDGTPEGLKAVKKGELNTTLAQRPDEIGRLAVRNAIRLAKGSTAEKEISVPVKVVDGKNVDQGV